MTWRGDPSGMDRQDEVERLRDEIDELREREVSVARELNALGENRTDLPRIARAMRDRAEKAEAELKAYQRAAEALRKLEARIVELEPAFLEQATFSHAHGLVWTAGTWTNERAEARAALAELDKAEGKR